MFDEVYKLIEKSYLEHKATLDSDHSRDFLDVFIKQMNEAEKVVSDSRSPINSLPLNIALMLASLRYRPDPDTADWIH